MRPPSFLPQREDGRSAAQVIIDFVKAATPGTVFSFRDLQDALDLGDARKHTIVEVRQAVFAARKRLLEEYARRLHNVRGMGYRMAPAHQHMALARTDCRRADAQLKRGRDTLRHVRWEEMDENTRKAHEGHLMIAEALYTNQVSIHKRLSKIEEVLKSA